MGSVVLQGCSELWMLLATPLQGITPSSSPLCLLQMHSPIPGLGRVMVFLAAALASASLAVPEDREEEGEPCLTPPPLPSPPCPRYGDPEGTPFPPGRHRPTRVKVYAKCSPVARGVLWPATPCSCPLPSPDWDQSFPVPPGGTCMKQDPRANTQVPRGVQPQAAHLDP